MLTAFLQRNKTPPHENPAYDTKLSDGKAPVLELWEMKSTPSLPLLIDSLSPIVVVPVTVLSMGQIKLFNYLTVFKQNYYC